MSAYPSATYPRLPNSPRFVLADTEELHGQIAQMSQRIRQLEDALSVTSNPDTHGDRHPLLRDELLAVKFGSGPQSVSDDNEDQFTLSFGTLAVTESGGSSYFGVSAGVLVSCNHTSLHTPGRRKLTLPSCRQSRLLSKRCQAVRRIVPRCLHTTSGITARGVNQGYPRMWWRTFGTLYLHTLKRFICASSTQRSTGSSPFKSTISWTTSYRLFTRVN